MLAYPASGLSIRGNLDAKYDDFEFGDGFGIVGNSHLYFRRAPEVTATCDWAIGSGNA